MHRAIECGLGGWRNPDADKPCGPVDPVLRPFEPVHVGGCKGCRRVIIENHWERHQRPKRKLHYEQLEFPGLVSNSMAAIPMARDEAIRVAKLVYETDEAAVVELLLLATNGERVQSYRALRALLLFDPHFHAMPTWPQRRCA